MDAILGSSVSTKFQIMKYLKAHDVDGHGDIIDLYMLHGATYGVQADVAIAMAIIYTDFFKREIVNNNLVGIGKQFRTDHLESFATLEDCIIAQYEILRTGADAYYIVEDPHSYTYVNLLENKGDEGDPEILIGSIQTMNDVYTMWKLDECGYTLEDFWLITRDIPLIREEEPEYINPREIYFFVLVKTSDSRDELLRHKGKLVKYGFNNVKIHVDKGYYRLEVGQMKNERDCLPIQHNLKIYGYPGTIMTRKKENIR